MSWIVLTLASALFLGLYDLSTKHAVRDNAVLPVLFLANVCSATIWLLLLAWQAVAPAALPTALHVDDLTAFQHLEVFLKSAIVAASWLCTYFAMKQLPLSLASPIRATSPVWTLLGALVLLQERPTVLEIIGVGTTIASFLGLSIVGREEGVHFHRNKWVGWLMLGTLLGTGSALYDKYLFGHAGFRASTVQCWFAIYLAVVFLPFFIGWKLRWWPRHDFQWRWSIPLLAVALLLADFAYFTALRDPEALISLVSSLRRGSTLVAFAGGVWLFRERYTHGKLLAVLGVLAGIVLTILG